MLFSCLQFVRTLPMRLFVLLSVFALASCGGGGGSSSNTGSGTTASDASLSALSLSSASLDQIFQSTQLSYTSSVNFLVNAIGETATLQNSGASLTIDGKSATSGSVTTPVYLATGSNTVKTVVTATDGVTTRTYSIDVTRKTLADVLQQSSSLSDALSNDDFGVSIAISGKTMVVGADYRDTGVYSNNGAAFVYTYDTSSGKWIYQTTLTASSPANNDHFGKSVAIDGNTIVVGAPDQDTAGFNAGAAYVFTGSGSSWAQQGMLTVTSSGSEHFGSSVAVSGNTIVVGSPYQSAGVGAAYVFVNTGTGWATPSHTKLTDSNLGSNDKFGNSVAIDGNTVVVGAPNHAISSVATGAAYVFTGSGTNWTEQPMLSANNGANLDSFGATVSISGSTIAVGATGVSSNTGAAYVFYNDGSGWTQQGNALQANNKASGAAFGYSIALSGERLVVGADTEGASQSGAVYVFMRNGNSWSQTAYLKANDAAASDYFGSSVGIDNDILVTGARNKTVTTTSGSATGAGAMYAFQ